MSAALCCQAALRQSHALADSLSKAIRQKCITGIAGMYTVLQHARGGFVLAL